MRKSLLWKTSRWNARLIYSINENNNKNNNKNQVRINKASEKFPPSEKNLSIIKLKYFFCTHLIILLPLTFSNFVILAIHHTLKFKAYNLKYLPSYIFIVSSLYLTLHCNKWFLLLNCTMLDIFVSKCPVSLFRLHFKTHNRSPLWKKRIWLYYISFRKT